MACDFPATYSGNQVTDAFAMIWNSWLTVLCYLGVHEPAGVAVEITVISIILGAFLFIILDKIVLAKIFAGVGGGYGEEGKSKWPALIIAVAIVILNIYSGTIMIMIPLFYVILIALPLIGIYIFFVSTRQVLSPFRTMSADLDKEANARRTTRMENAQELREIKESENMDKFAMKAANEMLELEKQIMSGTIKFEALLKSIQKALNSTAMYAKAGEANPAVLQSFSKYLASVAAQLEVEREWLLKIDVIEKGITREMDAEKLRVKALLDGVKAKLAMLEKSSFAQLKLLGMDTTAGTGIENLEKLEQVDLKKDMFGGATTRWKMTPGTPAVAATATAPAVAATAPQIAADATAQENLRKASLKEAQKLKGVSASLRQIMGVLTGLETQFVTIEGKLKAYDTTEEAGRDAIIANATALKAALIMFSQNFANTPALAEAKTLVNGLLAKTPIEIKRDAETEKLVEELRTNLAKQEGELYKLQAELKQLEFLDEELDKIEGVQKTELKKEFKDINTVEGISRRARIKGRFRRK